VRLDAGGEQGEFKAQLSEKALKVLMGSNCYRHVFGLMTLILSFGGTVLGIGIFFKGEVRADTPCR
jgi:hypothetical protein